MKNCFYIFCPRKCITLLQKAPADFLSRQNEYFAKANETKMKIVSFVTCNGCSVLCSSLCRHVRRSGTQHTHTHNNAQPDHIRCFGWAAAIIYCCVRFIYVLCTRRALNVRPIECSHLFFCSAVAVVVSLKFICAQTSLAHRAADPPWVMRTQLKRKNATTATDIQYFRGVCMRERVSLIPEKICTDRLTRVQSKAAL